MYNIVGYAKHKIIVNVYFKNIKRKGWEEREKRKDKEKNRLKIRICWWWTFQVLKHSFPIIVVIKIVAVFKNYNCSMYNPLVKTFFKTIAFGLNDLILVWNIYWFIINISWFSNLWIEFFFIFSKKYKILIKACL